MTIGTHPITMDTVDIDTWTIDYRKILDVVTRSELSVADALRKELSSAWVGAYTRSVRHDPRVCVISLGGLDYLFDDPSAAAHAEGSGSDEFVCERVVAVHGRSQPSDGTPRRASRIRGFPRGAASDASVVDSVRHDRGHFMAHASGGGTDINLFPQLKDVNRGWSKRGRVYRRMENYLVAHPGTYCFSRSIYSGWTDHPYVIEFGLLGVDENLWVELFPNCRSADEMRAIEVAVGERIRERQRG